MNDLLNHLERLEDRIKKNESASLRARWDFGQQLLKERIGKKLPIGLLDEISTKIKINRVELQRRIRFASRYPTEEALCHAVTQWPTWHELIQFGLQTTKRAVDGTSTDVDFIDGGLWRLYCGDAWQLAIEPLEPIQAIVTSPPYWRQRVYKDHQEFGQETVTDYVTKLVALFDALKPRLQPTGAAWINLGDSYERDALQAIPARFMVTMIEAGWQLRSEVIYERLNMTPRPARKRPTRSHEHVLLFTLSDQYFYDEQYMREDAKYAGYKFQRDGARTADSRLRMDGTVTVGEKRNMRSVWQGSTGWNGAIEHPALMPKLMAERCVLSISRPGDWVLDPFCGAATTGYVAIRGERSFIGWDIDARYIERAKQRLAEQVPLLGQEVTA